MGRRKKQEQQQPSAEAERQVEAGEVPAEKEAAQPPRTHNLSFRDRCVLLRREKLDSFQRSLAEIAAAKSELDSLKQTHRAEFGKPLRFEYGSDALDILKDMVALGTPEGESAMQAEINRKLQVAEFMASDIGTQLHLFDQSREPAVDRAARIGKYEGASDLPFDNSRWAIGTPQARAYEDGYYAGQKDATELRVRAMGPIGEAAVPAPLGPPEPTVGPADVGRREGLMAENEAGYDPHRYFDDKEQKEYHEAFMAAQIERVSARLEHMGVAAE